MYCYIWNLNTSEMKPVYCSIVVLFLYILINSSCTKSSSSVIQANLVGKWKWVSTYHDYPQGPTNPSTPANSGIQEYVIFNADASWKKIQNNITVDSGTCTTGHGSYQPYPTATKYVYDSVWYNNSIQGATWDYYRISNDTLTFSGGFAGIYGSDSKMFIKL